MKTIDGINCGFFGQMMHIMYIFEKPFAVQQPMNSIKMKFIPKNWENLFFENFFF